MFSLLVYGQDKEGFLHYYKNPEPEKIIYTILDNRILISEKLRHSTIIFIAMAMREKPYATSKLYDDFKDKAPGFLNSFYESLWWSNTEESKAIILGLDQAIKEKYSSKPPDLLSMPLKDHKSLDLLWAAFCATGDIAYVSRVYEAAMATSPEEGFDYLTTKFARMVLPPNADLHEKVADFLVEQRNKVKGKAKRDILLSILEKAGLKNSDG